MGLIEDMQDAAAHEAACWEEVELSARRSTKYELARSEHELALQALLVLTRQWVKQEPRPRGKLSEGPPPVEFHNPLRPERTVRRLEPPPSVVLVPPIDKDPMTVPLSGNQWDILRRLDNGPVVPLSEIQKQVLAILSEARLAWPIGITGSFGITPYGRARFKAGRAPKNAS